LGPGFVGNQNRGTQDGRRRERPGANGKKTLEALPREQWIALFPDAHPGYISWHTYETNQKLLLGNATAHGADRAAGPAREGAALLQGLAICGRCGRQMTVRYHTRLGVCVPDYQCMNRCIQDGARRCQSVPGGVVDEAVATLLLEALTPHALEVALTVQAELDTRAAEADALRRGHAVLAGEDGSHLGAVPADKRGGALRCDLAGEPVAVGMEWMTRITGPSMGTSTPREELARQPRRKP